jgi:hypothetical protein
MKSKLSLKVLGVVITLATLASLLVGITAAPAGVSAATNQMVFTPYSLPSNLNYFIGGAGTPSFASGAATTTTFTGAANSNPTVTAVTASADGNSIYAWDDAAKILYYSSNAGKSFTALAFNTAVPAPGVSFGGTFVDLEVSPKFATDGTVVLATSTQVWMISGGLATANNVTGDLATKLEGGTITSMDVGSYYTNGVLAVYIGVRGDGVHNAFSNVLVFQAGGFTWAEVGAMKFGSVGVFGTIANGTVIASTSITSNAQSVTFSLPSMAVTAGTATATPATLSTTALSTALTVTNTAVGQSFTVTLPAGFTGTATPTAPMTISAGAALVAGVNTITVSSAAATGTITVAITNALNFTVTNPAGVSGNATSGAGGATVTGSPLTLAAGATTTVVITTLGALTINTTLGGAGFDPAVLAVKLSPNYQSDAEVMAVYTDSTTTYLSSNIAALGWNNSILPVCPLVNTSATPAVTPYVATSAVIEAGTDYFANSTGTVLVGTNLALYKISGRVATGGTVTNILNQAVLVPNGIAVQGPTATAAVVVASPNTSALNITTAVTASTVTWVGSAAYRGVTGTAITGLWYCGTNNAKLLVGSTGFVNVGTPVTYYSGDGGAINVSADNGNTFNQIGLISVQTSAGAAGLAGLNPTIDIVSDTSWFSNLSNNGGECQSTDKGVSWVRVFGKGWGANNASCGGPARSQSYATNNTWVITNGSNIALLTSNNGSTYSPIGSPIAIGSFNYIENDAYYIVSAGGDPAGIYFSSRPYVNATFTPAITNINSIARSGKDATHMTFAVGSRQGTVYLSTDGAVTFTQLAGIPGIGSGERVKVKYASDGTLYAFGASPNTTFTGLWMYVPATTSWLNIAAPSSGLQITKPVKGWSIAGDGTAYVTVDDGVTTIGAFGYGIYRSLNYNAVNPDGTTGATWAQIYQYDFPNGTATASIGSSSTGYPGVVTALNGSNEPAGASGNWTAGVGVFASAATGNTLQITENTSTVTGSGVNQVIYTFVDSYTNGPVVVSPKDKTILTTDTSVSLNWTAMNGPAGGSTNTSTNYDVQVTASTDFSGATTPVFDTANTGLVTQNMDYYKPGNTTATMGINPGAPTYALKGGTPYSWRVMATYPLPSRWTTQTFTTALTNVNGTPVPVNAVPANGATGVDVNTTFTWPAVSGTNVTYEFVIAEETGQTDKFAIIDYSATCPTNATPLREQLKYNTQYWWRVRATNGTVTSGWSTFFFTTGSPPVTTTASTGPAITVTQPPATTFTFTQPPATTFTISQPANNSSIPPALLWAVIAIGAILIIAVIVLIVRTRRIP